MRNRLINEMYEEWMKLKISKVILDLNSSKQIKDNSQ